MIHALIGMAVAGLAAGSFAAAPPGGGAASQPASRPASAPAIDWARHYYDRVEQFKRENAMLNEASAPSIVMVGSSHIEGFKSERLLPGRRVANRGIASDRIGLGERGVLRRLDSSVFDCRPGVIIIENGVNDLGELWRTGKPSLDEIEACYRQVVGRIRGRLPGVPLVIVSLFPTRGRFAELKPFIVAFNQRLVRISADFNCAFMDMYAPLADEQGLLGESYSRDGLHLNETGYRVWARKIAAELDKGAASQPTSRPSAGPSAR